MAWFDLDLKAADDFVHTMYSIKVLYIWPLQPLGTYEGERQG
jgi:hypothetical protein